tara:strand:+ start:160 stop:525 length:366 start_codon:yes stop_codon:yes gene_type:complete
MLKDGSKHQTVGVTVSSTSADGSATVVYTTPANYSGAIRYLHISNNNSAAKKVSVQYYDAASTNYHFIAKDLSMSANSVTNLVNNSFFFTNPGDKIVAFGETANTMELFVSVEEFFDPHRG